MLRMQILEAIRANGPMSVPDLSELFQIASTGLYYHIRLLQKAGLIHATDARTIESFAATHPRVQVKCNLKSAMESKRLRKLVEVFAASSKRSFALSGSAATSGDLLKSLNWENLNTSEVANIRVLQKKIAAIIDQAKTRRSRAKSAVQSRANWHIGAFIVPVSHDHFPVTAIHVD